MATGRVYQSAIVFGALLAVWCLGVAACLGAVAADPQPALRHPAVTASAGLTVLWMFVGWFAMLRLSSRTARFVWTLGWLMLVAHLLIAFAMAHEWSHAAAVEHVREVGGSGVGIVVNYLFALAWLFDVAWWWLNPASHASRSRRASWWLHGFLLFVVVNATVVFGPPERRGMYAAGLALLGVLALMKRVSERRPSF